MTKSFVLIPGAGGMAWYWHRVLPLLQGAHHGAIAVDLPGDDESVGLTTMPKSWSARLENDRMWFS